MRLNDTSLHRLTRDVRGCLWGWSIPASTGLLEGVYEADYRYDTTAYESTQILAFMDKPEMYMSMYMSMMRQIRYYGQTEILEGFDEAGWRY